jgi:hypothetical protein
VSALVVFRSLQRCPRFLQISARGLHVWLVRTTGKTHRRKAQEQNDHSKFLSFHFGGLSFFKV